MSAENGIYILRSTRDWLIKEGYYERVPVHFVYRVAYSTEMQNYEFIEQNEPHNLGYFLWSIFNKSDLYLSEDEAFKKALEIEKEYSYTEYGIVLLYFGKKYPGEF